MVTSMKIAVTGIIVLFFAGVALQMAGKRMPRLPIAILILGSMAGGLVAAVGGILWSVWTS